MYSASTMLSAGLCGAPLVRKALRPLLMAALTLAHRLGDGVNRRTSAFNRSVLLIVFSVAIARSLHGFLLDPSHQGGIDKDEAEWVYLWLALLTALSFVAHERLPAFRTCAFALPTTALGVSFIVLDFRTRLGWVIVAGTVVAATPMIVLELLRACPRRGRLGSDGGDAAASSGLGRSQGTRDGAES